MIAFSDLSKKFSIGWDIESLLVSAWYYSSLESFNTELSNGTGHDEVLQVSHNNFLPIKSHRDVRQFLIGKNRYRVMDNYKTSSWPKPLIFLF